MVCVEGKEMMCSVLCVYVVRSAWFVRVCVLWVRDA